MWSDVLTKPCQGKGYCLFRSHLMNVLEDHDNYVEGIRTNPILLPKYEKADGVAALVNKGCQYYKMSLGAGLQSRQLSQPNQFYGTSLLFHCSNKT